MTRSLCRRRFLTIAACGAVLPRVGRAATVAWRGVALGAEASITLGGTGRAKASETFAAVEAELDRLENIFSLFRSNSALSRLNRDGHLVGPPDELLMVLRLCDALHRASDGAFDPTVQPLWLAHNASIRDADDALLETARRCVGWRSVSFAKDRIEFERPGMAITLNGIAQGYITDRIADLLRDRGFLNVLVDMGEIAALGFQNGAEWSAGIATREGRILRRITIADRCLAVSATGGTMIGASPRVGHILDPRPGRSAPLNRLAAVSAASAAIADGLSTACCLLSAPQAANAIARFPGAALETLI